MKPRIIPIISLILITITIYAQPDSVKIVAFGNSTTAPRSGVEKVYSVRLHEKLNLT
jgi:hypothetical protein